MAAMASSNPVAGGTANVFKSSISSRRFPALAHLTADDVDVVVLKPSGGESIVSAGTENHRALGPDTIKSSEFDRLTKRSSSAAAEVKQKAQRDRAAAAAAAANAKKRELPPFRPCNPRQARDGISVKTFVNAHSPFDAAHQQELADRADSVARMVGPEFVPTSGPRGREVVKVNYFLNSPDAETIAAEKELIHERAAYNLAEFKRRAADRTRK
eukprot:scaffold4750_cov140-Isochrysis_galbana.AAC.14